MMVITIVEAEDIIHRIIEAPVGLCHCSSEMVKVSKLPPFKWSSSVSAVRNARSHVLLSSTVREGLTVRSSTGRITRQNLIYLATGPPYAYVLFFCFASSCGLTSLPAIRPRAFWRRSFRLMPDHQPVYALKQIKCSLSVGWRPRP